MGANDTASLGLKTPPNASTAWGPGDTYDVNANFDLIDAVIANDGLQTYIVGKGLDSTSFPYLADADSRRVFDTVQGAIDHAEANFSGGSNACSILIFPGLYSEAISFNGACSIHLGPIFANTPFLRDQARNYGQVHIRNVVDGGADVATITANLAGTLTGTYVFDSIYFSNSQFDTTGTGSKTTQIFTHKPTAGWTSANAYFLFKGCGFQMSKANSNITWAQAFAYDKVDQQDNFGGLLFDGCRFRFPTTAGLQAITNGFYLRTHASDSAIHNRFGWRNCVIGIGIQDATTWYVASDEVHGTVEHCALSEGVDAGQDVCTIAGGVTTGDVLGVQGGSDPTYGFNVQTETAFYWT
jgi:hypothetical protein